MLISFTFINLKYFQNGFGRKKKKKEVRFNYYIFFFNSFTLFCVKRKKIVWKKIFFL